MKATLKKFTILKDYRLKIKCPCCRKLILLDLRRFEESQEIGCFKCVSHFKAKILEQDNRQIKVELEKINEDGSIK